ncbi:hypothetical protein VPH35_068584 [Triticum aestivum]
MRIRRAASLLLGVAPSASSSSQPPRPNLPPLPPADAGGPPPCVTNMAVADLMDQLGIQDPEDDKQFKETYFWDGLPSLPKHHPWGSRYHFPATTCADSIEEKEEMAVDMLDDIILEPRVVEKNSEKNKSTTTKGEEEKNKSKQMRVMLPEEDIWPCKQNERRFYGRPTSQPNSYCLQHSHRKPLAISKPPHSKRITAHRDLGLGFYYYDGFSPSLPEPIEQKEEVSPEHHVDFSAGLVGVADEENQFVSESEYIDKARSDIYTDVMIAGYDDDSSDEDSPDYNGENIKVSKNPLKKRGKKPLKARSLKSLM